MTEVILQVYPALGAEDEMLAHRPIGHDNPGDPRPGVGLLSANARRPRGKVDGRATLVMEGAPPGANPVLARPTTGRRPP